MKKNIKKALVKILSTLFLLALTVGYILLSLTVKLVSKFILTPVAKYLSKKADTAVASDINLKRILGEE